MRPAKKLQILIEEVEEDAKSRRSPSPTKKKLVIVTPEPKVIMK